jgi:hypothetical protein
MAEVSIAYFPVIGRGEQLNIICAMHGIKVNSPSVHANGQ